ncbi:SDR family NAD(P)-dependent oxidoreductase [Thermasporomyces composti]|jgi:NAD(P)-dependent dehydrogenase (short-subunit alcohol dehydrogenase family)|uniref:NAD(P)-dependent dehydrogenase (Short-subunit alcohol dehydrogenase family) n=1 Tax=Thermasporomyces composti TaxID=696763 RepID=A0A3D9V564_THECX|nr:glucose 1-dehydrogenase [Thermasporomyces composti]REF36667.1 NAD(P)-dependent dehydrogenase (short-subunit alcohol dehydrogenase family) [Thermasporomyces composti]
MSRFTDQVALITGGSSGIGLATARRFVAEGAHVVITGRDRRRLDAAVAELGDRCVGVAADVGDPDGVDAATTAVRERHGRLDIVVANAGTGTFKPFAEITVADFERTVAVNFRGVFFTIQRALPLLAEGARIVVNASWTLHRGNATASLYSATKAAVHNLARTLAAELGPRGVRINSVSPGYIDTPMYPEAELDPAEAAANRGRVPAGRFGRPEEVAAAIAFLASPEGSYINGQDLIVDGGLVAVVPGG